MLCLTDFIFARKGKLKAEKAIYSDNITLNAAGVKVIGKYKFVIDIFLGEYL